MSNTSNLIQVFKPMYRTQEVLDSIEICLESGWTGSGFRTDEFEEEWKKYSGFNNCHFVNSATAGLHLAVRILKQNFQWKDDDEIITTPLTFISTNHVILYENMKPVFADVDKSLCMNPLSVKKLITSKTKAIIYVGIGGNTANYLKIVKVCKEYNLRLIVDAAHMAGSRVSDRDKHVGIESDCTVFSFQSVKNCPSADSGAVCFSDGEHDKIARKMSWLGIDKTTYDRSGENKYKWKYNVEEIGYKYHGNSIMASMCLVALKYLDCDNSVRRKIADKYTKMLSHIKEIEIIQHENELTSSRHLFQISTDERDSLLDFLASHNIYCGVHYIENTQYPIYHKYENSNINLAKHYSDRLISLPLHLHMNDKDVDEVIRIISVYFGYE
jgi:dTDP-4-amino-4,6-dideoxygalactose transaminase